MQEQRAITLDDKLRYLREIESIHRLSKKVLPPKGTTWAQIADKQLKLALGLPVKEQAKPLNIKRGRPHSRHSPRSARIIERTLRNGSVHPDVLHQYRGNNADSIHKNSTKRYVNKLRPLQHTPNVTHIVAHGASDVVYPDGHLQGYGFVPGDHEVNSHIQLESAASDVKTVPTEVVGHYQ